jgi:hypothetical protein
MAPEHIPPAHRMHHKARPKSEMNHVKATIDKDTKDFVTRLKPDFRKYWTGPVPQARTLNLSDQAISTTNAIITLTLVIN